MQQLQEIRLSSVLARKHFVYWDPKVFMPECIWNSVSFLLDRDITDSYIYFLVVVLFYVGKTLRDREPGVWKELNSEWDSKFPEQPEQPEQPGWDGQRYGSILFRGELGDGTHILTVLSMADPSQTVRTHIGLGTPFDFAIQFSDKSDSCPKCWVLWRRIGSRNWLKDCLRYYSLSLALRPHIVTDRLFGEAARSSRRNAAERAEVVAGA